MNLKLFNKPNRVAVSNVPVGGVTKDERKSTPGSSDENVSLTPSPLPDACLDDVIDKSVKKSAHSRRERVRTLADKKQDAATSER